MMASINNALNLSEEKISLLRGEIGSLSLPPNLSVVTTGSFARREANRFSDLDFYLLIDNNGLVIDSGYVAAVREAIGGIVKKIIGEFPSDGGAFGGHESVEDMLINIGGRHDDNDKITRRILLLLEGEWLSNKVLFDSVRKRLVGRYIDEKIKESNIARFLLNDIIRYYRTICVDFEYKTFEVRKEWGIRNIKLVYSRKLLYFSGILCVAETADSQDKRGKVLDMIGKAPIYRIVDCVGERECEQAMQLYGKFLDAISDGDVRNQLGGLTRENHEASPIFSELKKNALEMSEELKRLLTSRYDVNPIHTALLF